MTHLWWILALLSGLGLAGRNVLMKQASLKIDAGLAAMILSLSMAAVSIGYVLYQKISRETAPMPETVAGTPWAGIMIAAVAGISLASANIFLAYSYKSGGDAGLVAILQNGISISVTLLIGVLFLQEVIKPQQMVGIALAMAGILLIVKR